MEVTELHIPVPWGHIAAKAWGEAHKYPVLAVHGLQDNAGTFDRLIPMLPKQFYYVAIDLPGHGQSSHLPPGVPYYFMDWITAIKRVVDHFEWNELYYLGHSLGGQIGQYFSLLYPSHVSRLILLDVVQPILLPTKYFVESYRSNFARLQEIEQRQLGRSPPCYSYEEALKRMRKGRVSVLTDSAAKTLLQRSIEKYQDGYRFVQDQRLKAYHFIPLNSEAHLEIIKSIRCSLMIIVSSESRRYLELRSRGEALKVFRKTCPSFKVVHVEGNHDVHNNSPEKVADYISKFLLFQRSSL